MDARERGPQPVSTPRNAPPPRDDGGSAPPIRAVARLASDALQAGAATGHRDDRGREPRRAPRAGGGRRACRPRRAGSRRCRGRVPVRGARGRPRAREPARRARRRARAERPGWSTPPRATWPTSRTASSLTGARSTRPNRFSSVPSSVRSLPGCSRAPVSTGSSRKSSTAPAPTNSSRARSTAPASSGSSGDALASPGMERLIAEGRRESGDWSAPSGQLIESQLLDQVVVVELLESEELWMLVDEIAQSPAVTDAITQQSLGLRRRVRRRGQSCGRDGPTRSLSASPEGCCAAARRVEPPQPPPSSAVAP